MTKKHPEVEQLEALIRHHNELYWDKNAPIIDDVEYDALVEKLRALAPDAAVLSELLGKGQPVAPTLHSQAMLSLDKCYEPSELMAFCRTFEGDVVAMPKFDGIACALRYDDRGRLVLSLTRGDGTRGEDITANVREMADVPRAIPVTTAVEVRGELYMRLSVFEKYRAAGMANPRNLAAGAIKQKDPQKSRAYGLSFAAYELLGTDAATVREKFARLVAMGFPPVPHECVSKDDALLAYERIAESRTTYDFEIDGVVFKADSVSEQERLGHTAHHPRYAIAYKFQGDSGITTLSDIEWSVARTGAITPVARVLPLTLSGVTVSRASLHNVAFIEKLGLSLGARVQIVRRGGVIPHVERCVEATDVAIVIPSRCPSCGKEAVRQRDFLMCTDPLRCKAATIGSLAHFASAMDILGFGDAMLDKLYDLGALVRPGDYFRLTETILANVERSGEKLARRLLDQIERRRSVPLSTFLFALGLADVGKTVAQKLADRYGSLAAVRSLTEADLCAEHGIGEVMARSITSGLYERRADIDDLLTFVTPLEQTALAAPVGSGPLAGRSFLFTGKLESSTRPEAEARVLASGGSVRTSVSAGLSYLVVGTEKGGPSAKKKAFEKLRAKGDPIELLTEAEFLTLIEQAERTEAQAP